MLDICALVRVFHINTPCSTNCVSIIVSDNLLYLELACAHKLCTYGICVYLITIYGVLMLFNLMYVVKLTVTKCIAKGRPESQ